VVQFENDLSERRGQKKGGTLEKQWGRIDLDQGPVGIEMGRAGEKGKKQVLRIVGFGASSCVDSGRSRNRTGPGGARRRGRKGEAGHLQRELHGVGVWGPNPSRKKKGRGSLWGTRGKWGRRKGKTVAEKTGKKNRKLRNLAPASRGGTLRLGAKKIQNRTKKVPGGGQDRKTPTAKGKKRKKKMRPLLEGDQRGSTRPGRPL